MKSMEEVGKSDNQEMEEEEEGEVQVEAGTLAIMMTEVTMHYG